MELYDWQKDALEHYKLVNALIVQAGTGTGKTLLAMRIIDEMLKDPLGKILIVVPKIVILEQVWMKELYNHGYPPNKVGMYYNEAKELAPITLTTMASCTRVPHHLFTHLIVDEVHNMMTPRLMKFLQDKHWQKRVGLSATIHREDYSHLRLSKVFGHNIYSYETTTAIKDGIVSKMKYHDVPIAFADKELRTEYEALTHKITGLQHARRAMMHKGGIGLVEVTASLYKLVAQRNDIIYHYQDKLDRIASIVASHIGKKIVIFNQRNSVSAKLYWSLLETGHKPVIINSRIKKNEQLSNMVKFKHGVADVLLASMSLDEGMNIPDIDVGIILSSNATPRQMIQRVGRILRKSKDKEVAHVYQVYLKDTIEEQQALKRAGYFRVLEREGERYV